MVLVLKHVEWYPTQFSNHANEEVAGKRITLASILALPSFRFVLRTIRLNRKTHGRAAHGTEEKAILFPSLRPLRLCGAIVLPVRYHHIAAVVIVAVAAAFERTTEAECCGEDEQDEQSPVHSGISNTRTIPPAGTAGAFSSQTMSAFACDRV